MKFNLKDFMKKTLFCILMFSTQAFAGTYSGYAKIASNYIWRGISFTENEPMVAGSLIYEHESGFYGSVYGANLKFAEPTLYEGYSKRELDFTAGYKKLIDKWAINLFVNRYEFYDQPKICATEYSFQLSYLSTTFEYNFLPNWFGYNSQSHYVRTTHVHAIDEKFNLIAGIGYNHQTNTTRTQDSSGEWNGTGFTSYMDYFAGIQIKEAGGFLYEIIYSDTNRKTISYFSSNPADDGKKADAKDKALTVSLTKAF